MSKEISESKNFLNSILSLLTRIIEFITSLNERYSIKAIELEEIKK